MPTPRTSTVLVTTYNRPNALALCLKSLFRQSRLPDEIIVCDDGSAAPTRELIKHLQGTSPVPLLHIWQPDEGFQLARIRNKGMAAARGEYLIQIDGDVILHPHYVKDQLRNATPGSFFSGNQFHLSPELTEWALKNPEAPLRSILKQADWSWHRLRIRALQTLMATFYRWENHHEYVLGCNMAFWRNDLLTVNGYDESFTGWGWEDTDVALRLINAGVTLRFLRLGGIQYHLYHHKSSRSQEDTNRERALEAKRKKSTYCQRGLSQHLALLEADRSRHPF